MYNEYTFNSHGSGEQDNSNELEAQDAMRESNEGLGTVRQVETLASHPDDFPEEYEVICWHCGRAEFASSDDLFPHRCGCTGERVEMMDRVDFEVLVEDMLVHPDDFEDRVDWDFENLAAELGE